MKTRGQARSEAERVAPGKNNQKIRALKGRNCLGISAPQALYRVLLVTRGDELRFAPRFHIPRRWRSLNPNRKLLADRRFGPDPVLGVQVGESPIFIEVMRGFFV